MKKIHTWGLMALMALVPAHMAAQGKAPNNPVRSTTTTTTTTTSMPTVVRNLLNNDMVFVAGGTFTMGATDDQGSSGIDSDERPTHRVTLSSYYICKYEVTQELYRAVMGSNPSHFSGSRKPVEMVSYYDCLEFCRKLSQMTGKKFRLPTEAEWEFAARGGNKSRHYMYSGADQMGPVAWWYDNSNGTTHDVGTKRANELGLYDMSGNVYEWCADWHGTYPSYSVTDPTGPTSGSKRIQRGSCYNGQYLRTADRASYAPDTKDQYTGFRVVMEYYN